MKAEIPEHCPNCGKKGYWDEESEMNYDDETGYPDTIEVWYTCQTGLTALDCRLALAQQNTDEPCEYATPKAIYKIAEVKKHE
jgi:hypothetical protein